MFDPYHRWLGIPKDQRPPTFYQLLGISPDESDLEVIQEAVLRQTSHVRLYQTGPYAGQCTAILNELGQARSVLLNPDKRRQYDAGLSRPAPAPVLPAQQEQAAPEPPPPVAPRAPLGKTVAPEEEEPALKTTRRDRGSATGATVPALGFGAVLLAGAVLAFATGRSRPSARPEPDPTPAPKAASVPTPPPRREALYQTLEGHEAAVRALAVSSDGLSVLSAGGSHTAGPDGDALGCATRLWTLPSGRLLRTFPVHEAPVHCLAISRDGQKFLTGGGGYRWQEGQIAPGDCVVRLQDIDNGKVLCTFSGHEAPVRGVAFLPDGDRAVSCSSDGSVLLWDLRQGNHQPLCLDPTPSGCLALSPRGRYVLVGGLDGRVRLWDVVSGKEIDRVPRTQSPVYALAFAPDGSRAACAGGRLSYQDGKPVAVDCVVRIWNMASGKVERTLPGHTRPIRAMAWTRDGATIVSGSLDGTVRLWDARGGKPGRTLEAGSPVTCIALAPGKRLLAGTESGAIRVWDLSERKKEEAGPKP